MHKIDASQGENSTLPTTTFGTMSAAALLDRHMEYFVDCMLEPARVLIETHTMGENDAPVKAVAELMAEKFLSRLDRSAGRIREIVEEANEDDQQGSASPEAN